MSYDEFDGNVEQSIVNSRSGNHDNGEQGKNENERSKHQTLGACSVMEDIVSQVQISFVCINK